MQARSATWARSTKWARSTIGEEEENFVSVIIAEKDIEPKECQEKAEEEMKCMTGEEEYQIWRGRHGHKKKRKIVDGNVRGKLCCSPSQYPLNKAFSALLKLSL
jgi:hypothetical protein